MFFYAFPASSDLGVINILYVNYPKKLLFMSLDCE